ncbi:MAG TPA: DUF2520 domain-containing protein [Pseudoclavibacter sp.]|nr:DUF2520 domain-containing protein [Pseudoclavibacter sp.]
MLDVGVIGAGRAGVVMAAALADAGHRIVGLSTTSERNRERVEAMLPGVPVSEIPQIVANSSLVVLAVPDEALPVLVDGMSAAGLWRPGQIVMHLAAGYGVGVLSSAVACGVIPIALRPNLVFTGTSIDRQRLRDTTATVTCPAPVLPIAQALAIELGCEPIVIAEEDRAAYAEALGVVTTFSRAVVEQATGILRNIGVENPTAVIASVAKTSVSDALSRGQWPQAPLTADEEDV